MGKKKRTENCSLFVVLTRKEGNLPYIFVSKIKNFKGIITLIIKKDNNNNLKSS